MSDALFVVSTAPASRDLFRAEVNESERAEFVEALDEHRCLANCRDGFDSLFWLHRFPVQECFERSDLSKESVESCDWDTQSLDPLRSGPYGIQISANVRLDWSFSELIDGLIETLDLPREQFVPRRPETVLSIYLHRDKERCRVFRGISTVEQNLSPWSSGQCRIPRDPDSVSRAEAKLLEGWEAFSVPTRSGGTALDLGAAPGGWTRVLQGKGYKVAAVDPATLDPRVESLEGVVHHRETSGRFLARRTGPYDLIVCDMKMEASLAAKQLIAFAPSVAPGGEVFTTFKLGKGPKAPAEARTALSILSSKYEVQAARQLYFNRSEITVFAKLKP